MTIKRQLLFVLILVAIISVFINTMVLSTLTNRYFKDYVKDNYDKHFNQIVDYLSGALKDENYSANQISVDLETHLTDPITRIKVYDNNGILIADVITDAQSYVMGNSMNHMMNNMMGRMKDTRFEEVDHTIVTYNGTAVGQVNITKYSSAEDSFATWRFQSALFKNSILSIGIVLLMTIIIGMLVSRKMSKELINTAEMAQNIEIGNEISIIHSKVKEIHIIQQSLESLQTRLKLKQKSRKTLIDELVHQTRTPLTILRTHLEGIEDGVIELVPDEIRVCENQIENITAIITNMSSMIDVEKMDVSLNIEEFELSHLVKQIINGLKTQFEKKNIEFKSSGLEKVTIRTDRYRLSQAIYNILTNAYKFTEPYGKVHVDYQVKSDNIIITIEDTGQGIRAEDQDKIFDAYYKKDRSDGTPGDGIGLYVAKENMLSIHGMITVDSEINKGSRFMLCIPRQI